MASPLSLRFVRSFADVTEMPSTDAELALVGRSNVGKSTLVNALAHRSNLAKTSKTPGATRLINAYELAPEHPRRWLVDLPGYGYAKASKSDQRRWSIMLGEYLDRRENLTAVLHLIDSEVGPTRLDLEVRQWLIEADRPVAYVATKSDKVRPSRSRKRRTELVAKLGVERTDVSWVSATKGTGVPELRQGVLDLLDS